MRDRARRDVLCATLSAGVAALVACGGRPASGPEGHKADCTLGRSPAESLMRDHGAVVRLLLIYDECARRLEAPGELRPDVVPSTARIVRTFVHGFHEQVEESFVFPRFEQALSHVDLVRSLKEQHAVGRRVTAAIEQMTTSGPVQKKDERKRLSALLRGFTRMARPHHAREDTVLFPDLRTLLAPPDLEATAAQIDQRSIELLGDGAFDKMLVEIDQLELALDIHDLSQLTASAGEAR
jgi:hemerythrin-like domain-containing protein